MTRPDCTPKNETSPETIGRIERWALYAQLAVIAVLMIVAAGSFVLITENLAKGVTHCRALKLAQCPEFLK